MNIYVNTNEQTTRYEPIYKSVCQGACFCSGACKAKHNIIGYKVIEPGLFGNTSIITVQEYEQIKQEEYNQIFNNMIQNIDKPLTEMIETPNVGVSLDCKLSRYMTQLYDKYADQLIFHWVNTDTLKDELYLYVNTISSISDLDVYFKIELSKELYNAFEKDKLTLAQLFDIKEQITVLICDDDKIIKTKIVSSEVIDNEYMVSKSVYSKLIWIMDSNQNELEIDYKPKLITNENI